MVVLREPAQRGGRRAASEMKPPEVIDNPPQGLLRRLTLQMANAKHTACESVDVFTRVDARSSSSTYIVTDDPEAHRGHQTMSRAEYEKVARLQDDYIADQTMIVIDGYIADADEVRTSARLVIEAAKKPASRAKADASAEKPKPRARKPKASE